MNKISNLHIFQKIKKSNKSKKPLIEKIIIYFSFRIPRILGDGTVSRNEFDNRKVISRT
jgi:hypothetical protein